MVEAKYFKDYHHNYLIIKCKEEGAKEQYQYRMLASGRLEKILKCSVRNINGAAYFYYDISSKVSIRNLYQGKKMSLEQVKDFFIQMDGIYRQLGEFFMEEEKLLLCPDYIYYDFSSRKYFGTYYPWDDTEADNIYEQLMDFLLNHIDTREQALVDIIYQIYEMSDGQTFTWTDALRLFEDIEENEKAGKAETIPGSIPEKEAGAVGIGKQNMDRDERRKVYDGQIYDKAYDRTYERMSYEGENNMHDVSDTYYGMEPDKKDKGENDGSKTRKENGIRFYHVFAVLSVCGIAGGVWVYFNYKLTQQETMIITAALGVMGLTFLFSLVQILLSGSRNRKREQEEEELIRSIEDEFREERPIVIGDVLDKNMEMAVAGHSFLSQNAYHEEEGEAYGKTVFIDVEKQKTEYKLYALDKKNKKHIALTQFPFTIGKMAGCVDCVLADDSVSRLHARIEKRDEKIFLTDMNSMNGTYKNGLRMMPSETVEIEPGDEIRFGKLSYCYR